jgi:Gas vesicle synthesis protein GvpL/GvpF
VPQGDDASLYVYGILPAADQANVSVGGVEEAEVRTVEHAGLAALVSTLQADALAAAREVRAHWRVLEEASKSATVVPVRFGTVMEGEAAVREQLLEPNAEQLRELLGQLSGRVQLNVRGDYDEERLLRGVVRASPQIAALRERVNKLSDAAGYYDRIRMGELVAAEIARRRQTDEALALTRLEPFAVAARAEQVSASNGAFNLAFLVEGGDVDRFSTAVGSLRAELAERVELQYVGPIPPYSFAETDLSTGAAAWA